MHISDRMRQAEPHLPDTSSPLNPIGNIKDIDTKFNDLIASIDDLDDELYCVYSGQLGQYKAAQLVERLWEAEKENRHSIER